MASFAKNPSMRTGVVIALAFIALGAQSLSAANISDRGTWSEIIFSGFWSLISATLIFYSSLYFCSKFDNPDCTDPQNKIMVCAGKKKQFFVGQWLKKLCFQGLLQSLWTDTVQYHSKEVQRGWLSKWQSLYIINSYIRSQGEFPLASPSRRPRLSQGS